MPTGKAGEAPEGGLCEILRIKIRSDDQIVMVCELVPALVPAPYRRDRLVGTMFGQHPATPPGLCATLATAMAAARTQQQPQQIEWASFTNNGRPRIGTLVPHADQSIVLHVYVGADEAAESIAEQATENERTNERTNEA